MIFPRDNLVRKAKRRFIVKIDLILRDARFHKFSPKYT